MNSVNYEKANMIASWIPDDCKASFWRTFDNAVNGDRESVRIFQIFYALYSATDLK